MKQITEAQVKNVDRKLQISIKTNFIITFQFSIVFFNTWRASGREKSHYYYLINHRWALGRDNSHY